MFRLGEKRKRKKFEAEIKVIDEEINRSRRSNFNMSILVVEMSHSVPRGLSKVLPGKTISFYLLKKFIRSYDRMIGPYWRRYIIVLPQTDRNGANVVKQRIYDLAKENNWGTVSIGMAVYPEDSKEPGILIENAISRIS